MRGWTIRNSLELYSVPDGGAGRGQLDFRELEGYTSVCLRTSDSMHLLHT
jgi:hypothetical protein